MLLTILFDIVFELNADENKLKNDNYHNELVRSYLDLLINILVRFIKNTVKY